MWVDLLIIEVESTRNRREIIFFFKFLEPIKQIYSTVQLNLRKKQKKNLWKKKQKLFRIQYT